MKKPTTKPNAAQATRTELEKIRSLMQVLATQVAELESEVDADPTNWGIHGPARHVREQLENMTGAKYCPRCDGMGYLMISTPDSGRTHKHSCPECLGGGLRSAC